MSATQVPFALPVSVYKPKTAEGWWVLDAFNNIAVRCDTVDHAKFVADCINNHAALVEAAEELCSSAERTLEVMPSFLDEAGLEEDDEEWIPILRARAKKARKALAIARKAGDGK